MVDLINNSDDCTRWRRKVGEQIDSAENVHQIFVLLNPPYYLTFIKFAASALSEKDLGQLLSTAWTQEECPNQDCNVSKRELVALFRSVSPESLMDEEERTAHQALEDTVTVYRGVTPYNAKISGRCPGHWIEKQQTGSPTASVRMERCMRRRFGKNTSWPCSPAGTKVRSS